MQSHGDIEFDWASEPKALRDRYKSTHFDAFFYKLIAKKVIGVMSPQLVSEPHNLIYDDELVHKNLIEPLERFICNLGDECSQDEIDKQFDHLKTLKQPTKMCRKVLKTGDVLFSCNDCGFDATCVVCIDCFHKSAHKDHNYRMSNTDGGGCCDCGDVEAWKQFPACSDHEALNQPNLKLSDFEDVEKRSKQLKCDRDGILEKISLLPKGFASRYFLVCQAALHYARMMLTWNDNHSLPQSLDVSQELELEDENDEKIRNLLTKNQPTRNYFTVLFNDEIHTYDHVINTLTKVIKCSKMTASIMASTVSREGRSLILQDRFTPCKQTRDAIATIRDAGQGPLKVEVIHGSILAHQSYALKLIEWIKQMSLLCDAFRVLTAFTLLGSYDPIPDKENPTDIMTLLERVMRYNTSIWKMARIEWNDLFVTSLLTEYWIKDRFARLLTRIYPKLVQDFIEDDHDHSVSVLTMSTQLYTVPSLVCMLIEEEDALSIMAQTFIALCQTTKRESAAIDMENRHTWDMHTLKRGFYIVSDIRHLINLEPTKWTDRLRENVIKSVKILLNLLDTMQGMDSVKRQVGQHIEFEPEWENGMTLQSRLVSLITPLVKYCSFDDVVLTETLRETQIRLLKDVVYKTQNKELFHHTANCIQYDVSTLPVSVHLPLTRFAAALIVELMQRRPCKSIPYDESLVLLATRADTTSKSTSNEESVERTTSEMRPHSMVDIMEPSLRTEVMIAQFRTGMWRRNGYSLVNQIIYFSGALMRKEMFDRDILLLQECAAMCEANKFMIHILNKFNLIKWVKSDTTREPLLGPKAVSFHNDEDIMTQTMSLGEEFLQILLTIIGERYRVGVGKIKEEDVIKHEIIQLLCIGPYTRSEIAHKLFASDSEIDCVKHVANLKRSSESSTGKYELKAEFYDHFNPFFYHYSRRHQSHALDAQLKRKRNLKESLICCPPPRPVELTDQFRNLNELLICDITLIIVQKVLRRALGPPADAVECSTRAPIRFLASDLQLDQCLHLIGLGLHEQERNPHSFNYIEAAHEKEIVTLLRDCYQVAKRSKDLVYWLVKKMNDIIDKMEAGNANNQIDNRIRIVYADIQGCIKPILSDSDAVKQESLKKNSELAAQRRERVMAMMRAKQASFMSNPATKQLAAETARHEAPPAHSQRSRHPATRSSSSFVALRNIAAGTSIGFGAAAGVSVASSAPADMDYELTPSSLSTTSNALTSTLLDEQDERMDAESITTAEDENSSESKANTCNNQSGQFSSSHLCILCRDEQVVGFDRPTMVLLAYIQRSSVLSKNRPERRIPNYALTPTNQIRLLPFAMPGMEHVGSAPEKYSFTSDNSWSFDASFMPADTFFGPYISTCGHAMHFDCWKGLFDTITKRETSRPSRGSRHVSFELEKNEILCPLCECISNATIPLITDYTTFTRRQHLTNSRSDCPSSTIFGIGREAIEKSADGLTAFLHALKRTVTSSSLVRHLSSAQQHGQQKDRDSKYMRLLQPTPINEVLKDLNEHEALVLRDFITNIKNERASASACTSTLLGAIQTLADRIHSVGLDVDKSITDVDHARIFMMTSWTISYTIQAHERSARFRGAPIFEDLESSKNLCLSSLLRFAISTMMIHQAESIQSLLVQKLRYLLISDEHQMSSPCCLDIDAFELFVSLFIMLQKLYSHIRDESSQTSTKSPSKQSPEKEPQPEVKMASSDSSAESSSIGSGCTNDSSTALDMSIHGPKGRPIAYTQQQQDYLDSYPWTTKVYDHEYFRNLLHLVLVLNLLQVSITILNDEISNEATPLANESQLSHADEQSAAANADDGKTATQTAKGQASDSDQTNSGNVDVNAECIVLQNFLRDMVLASGHPYGWPEVDGQFISRIKRALLPFLRSCAIFFYQLSQIQPNETLLKQSAFHEGENFASNEHQTGVASTPSASGARPFDREHIDYCKSNAEFDAICHYLNLPNDLGVLLRSKEARDLALTWLRHSRVLLLIKTATERKNSAVGSSEKMQESGINHGFKKMSSSPKQPTRVSGSSPGNHRHQQKQQPHLSITQVPTSDSELMPVKFIRQPHSVNRLIDLPYDYSELVDKVSNFTCPSIKNEDSRTPTMCLVCGVMLCSQSYCCQRDLNDLASNFRQVAARQQAFVAAVAGPGSSLASRTDHHPDFQGPGPQTSRADALAAFSALFSTIGPFPGGASGGAGGGAAAGPSMSATLTPRSLVSVISNPGINQQLVGSCTYHAHECSAGVGIFLRIRNCQILFLSGRSKGCYMPAPYIDDHGETDFGLLRGNPLHLNRQLYERLQNVWMSHTIPEKISRTLEYSPYASNIHWHLH